MTYVLVTGGAGYIGSHTCKALAKAGYVPVTYDNLSTGHEYAVKWGPFVCGDILHGTGVQMVLDQYRPAAVIHLAGSAYVGESVNKPEKYYRNNVAGSLSLLSEMVLAGVLKIVFSSSCAVYGSSPTPVSENHKCSPINPYGRTKLVVEHMLQDFCVYGLRSISLRYFNAAGADPDGEIGEDHDPEPHLIPRVLDVAAGIASYIEVNGDSHDTPDGTCIRDYTHVSDIAAAHVLALQRLIKNEGGSVQAFNLGTGYGRSVNQVIHTVQKVTGEVIPIVNGQRRSGDPAYLVANPSDAWKYLGWRASRSSLDTQVNDAWNWHRKQPRVRNKDLIHA